MKRFLTLLTGLVLVFGLSACDDTITCDKGQVLEDGECVAATPDPILDETAPVFNGVIDINYIIGETNPDFLEGITVTDDTDGAITTGINVDSSAVDLTVEGSYEVLLSVDDAAGNTGTAKFNVIVSSVVLTSAEKAALDINSIDLDTDFKLKIRYSNATKVTWTSSDERVISSGGYINRPAIGEDDVTVTLTAVFVNGDYTETKTYDILVEARVESTVTSFVELDFTGTSEEYVVADKEDIKVFYVDNGQVPYIDVQTFIEMMDGAIDSSELSYTFQNEDELVVSYDVEWEDFDGSIINETYSAVIDFTENTFSVDTFDFFENYVSDTSSDYGEGLNYTDADYRDSETVVIPLGDYKFDLVMHNDGTEDYFLMPFQVANLIFAGGIYYDAYYNGDEIIGVDTFGISSGGAEAEAIHENMRTSSYNDMDMTFDMKEASFHFMALTLDYFYGLKMDQEVDTYYDFLYNYVDEYMLKTDTKIYTKLFEIANDLNDLHTSHVYSGYYTDPDYTEGLQITSVSQMGPREQSFYQGLWSIQDRYEEKYGSVDSIPGYEVIDDGKTGVIHITGFSIDSPGEFEKALVAMPDTVENLVIDLAYNTGGNIGAVLRIFGYITEEPMQYHSQNPADGSAVTYYIESDYVAYDYNWYIVTSEVTFSAANQMASMAKELGFATLIGHQSSGGASSIGTIITPDGTVLLISTNNVLSTRTGNEIDGYEYISVEFGITPDIVIGNVVSDEEIIAAIAQDQAQ